MIALALDSTPLSEWLAADERDLLTAFDLAAERGRRASGKE